jgi:hypothetical protein
MSGRRIRKRTRWIAASALVVAAILLVGVLKVRNLPYVGVIQTLWSIGFYAVRLNGEPRRADFSPLEGNPIITAAFLGIEDAHYVADPFLVHASGKNYLFFEILSSAGGAIGLASSTDGRRWHYHGVVLAEPFHLSYPHVFKWQDKFYMVPESEESGSVRLYEAVEFPLSWRFDRVLHTGPALADPTVFSHDGRWWMFAAVGIRDLHLFHAAALQGPWRPHPANPILKNAPEAARPGGAVVRSGGKLYRIAQNCKPAYGTAVRAFEITTLTETAYAEREVADSPLLSGTGSGWNADGMHHLSIQQIELDSWLAVADGRRAQPDYIYLGAARIHVPKAVVTTYKWLRSLLDSEE